MITLYFTFRYLSLHSLKECTRIEKNAFKNIPNLSVLDAYGYPKLGYIDLQGLLQSLPLLEKINIETKDAAIGSDQLQSILHPRLKELGIRGSRLRSVSSGTLSGLKGIRSCNKIKMNGFNLFFWQCLGPDVIIRLMNTSLTSLPPALFFPVPRSTRITLDVTGSQLTTISPQMLAALEDRRGDLKIVGLDTNPVVCDCGARALRRWLPAHMLSIRCSGPDHLKGNQSFSDIKLIILYCTSDPLDYLYLSKIKKIQKLSIKNAANKIPNLQCVRPKVNNYLYVSP